MSVPSEFSRRFFADFIACLIRSRSIPEGGQRTATGPSALVDTHVDPIDPESAPAGPMVDRPGLLSGLGSTGI